jgi:hypothetical protein
VAQQGVLDDFSACGRCLWALPRALPRALPWALPRALPWALPRALLRALLGVGERVKI